MRIIPAAGAVPETIVEGFDQYTGTDVKYRLATTKLGGGAITDADLGPIYLKDTTTGKYYIRNWEGPVYRRWWNAKGANVRDDTAAWDAVLAFAAPLDIHVDGENKSCKIASLDLLEGIQIYNAVFNLTAGTYGLKIGEIGEAPVVYKRDLVLRNITFKGSCTYALIVSTITGVDLKKLLFITLTATNDVMYLLNTYDSEVDRLTFIACTAGVDGACLNAPAGVNGMTIGRIYTSAFTDYGVKITSGAALNIDSPVIQGARDGIYLTSCNGITVNNHYCENTVNPVTLDAAISDVGAIQFTGGFWAGPYPSHPKIALNNGVYIRYIGGTNNVNIVGGSFDVSGSSVKKLASVGSSAVLNIFRPKLSTGGSTPEVTDYLFKEATALSTAGYYVEYTRNANAYTTVSRTSGIANAHVVEYYDAGANVLRAAWNVPVVGSAAVALTFFSNRIGAAKTSSYTITTADDVIRFNTTSAPLTASLPVSNVPTGKIFRIKKTVAANILTVTCVGGVVTIDGVTSYLLSGIYDTITVMFDGTNYVLLSG